MSKKLSEITRIEATDVQDSNLLYLVKNHKDYAITIDNLKKVVGSGSYILPTASSNTLGGIKVGDRLTINDGVLSADDQSYNLPTASADTLGGIKVGSNLSIDNGVLSATDTTYSVATDNTDGLMSSSDKVKLDNIESNANNYSLPTATSNILGGVKIGDGLDINNGTVSVSKTVGMPIGTIFTYPSSVPPNGAFILNGQIISNCSTLYPEFWQWLNSNSNNIRFITDTQYTTELSSYGICGGFVLNTNGVNGSVRLPTLTSGFIEGSDGSNIGNIIGAGLPNITGTWSSVPNIDGFSVTSGSFSVVRNSPASGTSGIASGPHWSGSALCSTERGFDASRSSSIYGNSNTVQPTSVYYIFCIQVFNSATLLSNQESAQLASELQGKAGINLENITANGKALIQLYANELDYENAIENNITINTIYTSTTGGILVAYAVCKGPNPGVFLLMTAPDASIAYTGFQTGGNLTPYYGTSLYIMVPKGWQYIIGVATTDGPIQIDKTRFIPFKNSISI